MGSLARKLKQILKLSGCQFVRNGKGDHEVWFSPITQRHFVVDAGLDYNVAANEVLKEAGLPKQF